MYHSDLSANVSTTRAEAWESHGRSSIQSSVHSHLGAQTHSARTATAVTERD